MKQKEGQYAVVVVGDKPVGNARQNVEGTAQLDDIDESDGADEEHGETDRHSDKHEGEKNSRCR